MSRYILKPEYGLRSFIKLPRMCAVREIPDCSVLTKREWDFLIRCDGLTDIQMDEEENEWFRKSEVAHMVKEAGEGDTLTDWQKNIYHDNIYFPMVVWRITDRCNYNCRHCFNAADESAMAAQWDYDDACRFLEEAAACGINGIRLSGGEPMMHKSFLDIVDKIYENGMYLDRLITNGHYITPEILDKLASYGKKPLVMVSFDGFGSHDWMRDHAGAEEITLRAIDMLKEKGFPLFINAQINKKNKDSALRSLEYFDKLGVETLRFIRTTETPRWALKAGDAALTHQEYYDTMLDIVREYSSKPRNMILKLWGFGTFNSKNKRFKMTNELCAEADYRDTMPACSAARKQVCVAADGKLYPCAQMSGICDAAGISFGNVVTEDLQKLLKEGLYVDIATMTVGDIREKNEKCGACDRFKQCHGGCRGLGYLATGSFYGGNPAMCELAELNYTAKVREILPDWINVSERSRRLSADESESMC